jgi:hypothetical protein
VPLSVVVLIALFALQPQGSARIGKLFGPVMTVWFVTIGVLGCRRHGLRIPVCWRRSIRATALAYLFTHGLTGFLVLGACFCAPPAPRRSTPTWAISAPADPARLVRLVLPTLLLNYAGQAALVVGAAFRGRQSVLRAVPGGPAGAAGRARHRRDDHRQPGDHQRHLLDDAPGDPARPCARACTSRRPRRRATARSMSASSIGC